MPRTYQFTISYCRDSSPTCPPASLDALVGHFFDGSKHGARNLTIAYAPLLFRSGDATAEGSPSVAFDSATLTGVALPPHAIPLVMDHDGRGVPDQSERFESFEVVSAPSIDAVNGGGNDSDNAHTWWTDLLDLIAVHSVAN